MTARLLRALRLHAAAGAALAGLLGLAVLGAGKASAAAGGGWTQTMLLHLAGGLGGSNPAAGVALGPSGVLYGTLANGGAHALGAVFEARPGTAGGGAVHLLHSFAGGADGAHPMGGVILGAAGRLYGTTLSGGAGGHGAVFELAPPAAAGGAWSERVVYSFRGGDDGGSPAAGLAADGAGTLYGTTISGGARGRGTVFSLQPQPGGLWRQSVLHSFGGHGDGELPFAGVALGPAQTLYGTTTYGGSAGFGTVYALARGSPATVLYSFTGKADGGLPAAGIVIDGAGALYGTAKWGGTHASGVAFKLTPPAAPGQAWSEAVLHSFGDAFGSSADGGAPMAGVVFDGAGGLYGTTDRGGAHGHGTVYRLAPPAAGAPGWTASVLYSFAGGDGDGPAGGVTGAGGRLFGTTFRGGGSGAGTVFGLAP
jgi:uncharacterized repeat protein (TIGR03803 family)